MKLPPRGEAFRKKYIEQFKEEPIYGAFNAYAQVALMADAINAAKSDKPDDLVKALLASKFEGWNGTISFTRGEGPYWQQWTPPMLIIQYTKPEMPFTDAKIIFPPEFKTGDWMPRQALSRGGASSWTLAVSSTCCPDWSSASSTA